MRGNGERSHDLALALFPLSKSGPAARKGCYGAIVSELDEAERRGEINGRIAELEKLEGTFERLDPAHPGRTYIRERLAQLKGNDRDES